MNGNVSTTPNAESDSTGATSRPFARMRKRRRQSSQLHPPTKTSFPSPKAPSLFTVRPNPKHYVLRMAENSSSTERLVADSFIRSGFRTVGVVGLPGSGKTVILRAVAYDDGIHRAFRDAVALIGLVGATPKSLLNDLCEVVGRVCGISVRVHIESMLLKLDYPLAIRLIANALVQKRMLLLFDSVDAIGSHVFNLVAQLVQVSHSKPGYLAILFSCRSLKRARSIAEHIFVVKVLDPVGDHARSILCAHAEFDRTDFDAKCAVPDNSIMPVLLKCSGLPLALAVAGGAIKRLLKSATNEQSKTVIWAHYRKYLYENFDQFGEISGLFRSFTSCLNNIEVSGGWPPTLKIETALAALGKSKSDSPISRPSLQRIWNLESKKDVGDAINSLANLCMAETDIRATETGDENELDITVPKIILDYCCSLAAKKKNAGDMATMARTASHTSGENGKRLAPRGESTNMGMGKRQAQIPSTGERIQA